jgi:signal transduction histidine kinase
MLSPPSIYLTGMRVEGVAKGISELGETNLPQLELASDQNQISLDFVGLGASVGDELRYQYRLEGADSDWSPPNAQRNVNYAQLASGHYKFLVRAVNTDGASSVQPATVSFTILPHIYQRWWFVTLAGFLFVSIGYAGYRSRVARLLGIERVRTRIAADLHDDIGANLTRIGILSEVAHQQLHDAHPSSAAPLSSIARISRESAASMSDIVWAVNPRRDSLLDLVLRMRSFANEVLAGRQIDFQFVAPDRELSRKLGAELRRDVFLIFKEALNNAVRHSRCKHVMIELRLEQSSLALVVCDDGCGFALSGSSEGHGLVSMQRRAKSLGGELQLESLVGEGTSVSLSVPRRRWA